MQGPREDMGNGPIWGGKRERAWQPWNAIHLVVLRDAASNPAFSISARNPALGGASWVEHICFDGSGQEEVGLGCLLGAWASQCGPTSGRASPKGGAAEGPS